MNYYLNVNLLELSEHWLFKDDVNIYFMKKIYFLGDCHFSSSRDWDIESFTKFLDWYEDYDFGNFDEIELVQLGDLTEHKKLSGETINLLQRFINATTKKFSNTWVIRGNHCYDKDSHETAISFIEKQKDINNIHIIYDEQIFTTPLGFKLKCLPHKEPVQPLVDYYNSYLPDCFYTEDADILCGHIAIYEKDSFFGGIDKKKFKAKYLVFGHIHNRVGECSEDYTGSIMPFKVKEDVEDLPRVIKVFSLDKEVKEEESIELPKFRIYESFDLAPNSYPKNKKYSEGPVTVYTINNYKNSSILADLLQDYYYRIGKPAKAENSVIENNIAETTFTSKTPKEYFEDYISECEAKPSRSVVKLVKSLL